ncbi:hypothetical protein HDU84_000495 [Entophlyctis sp. JEL0112]|nr:hypothetical protein HDU84_000495 [Entophlyctis sp. JEL0112]
MKSMLVGGSAELDDITYNHIPFGHTGSKLIKYGFQTETSGTVNVRLNVAHQQMDQAQASSIPDTLRETDPTQFLKNNSKAVSGLMEIRLLIQTKFLTEALQRAKARLETLRATKKSQ